MSLSSPLIIGGDHHLDAFDDAAVPDTQLNRDEIEDHDLSLTFSLHMEDSLLAESIGTDEEMFTISSSPQSSTVVLSNIEVPDYLHGTSKSQLREEFEHHHWSLCTYNTSKQDLSSSCSFQIIPLSAKKVPNTCSLPPSRTLNNANNTPGNQHITCDFAPNCNNCQYRTSGTALNVPSADHSQQLTSAEKPDCESFSILSQETINGNHLSRLIVATRKTSDPLSIPVPKQTYLRSEQYTECSSKGAAERSPKRRIQRRRYRMARPSQYCHICARHSRAAKMLSCHNVQLNYCQKSVCLKCIYQYSLFHNAGPWICPHCKNQCPARARCHTYHLQTRRCTRGASQ